MLFGAFYFPLVHGQNTYLYPYSVQSGDTLSLIGSRFGVSWKSIATYNGISSPYTIYVGEVLLIPTANSTTSSSTSTSINDPIATGNQLYDGYDLTILSAASKYSLDPMIIKSQIAQESYVNPLATSPDDPCGQLIQNGVDVGHSYGLLQITPTCNSWFARNPDGTIDLSTNQSSSQWGNSAFNVVYNIDSGAFALYSSIEHAKQTFAGCTLSQYVMMGLAGYNSGWNSVYGCGSYGPRASAYTSNVLSWYQTFSSMSGWTNPY